MEEAALSPSLVVCVIEFQETLILLAPLAKMSSNNVIL